MNDLTRRGFGLLVGAGLVAARAGKVLGAANPDADLYVNPELKGVLPLAHSVTDAPLTLETLDVERRKRVARPPLDQPAWSERLIPGPAGAPDVRIYVVNAGAGGAPRPAILHTHGGGFVLQDARQALPRMQELALALDCVIVTVDYRLAPETRFPGSLEDNYAGLKWLYANAAQLDADPSRIAVLGESAGGGHAAMLAIATRDRGEIPLAYQALIYPMLDDRTGSTRKVAPHQGTLVWTPEKNRFGWASLLGMPAGSPDVPYGSVPARVEDLRGLPPTFIGVGSIDLFVDEDIDYARRLLDVGIPVTLNVVPGALHGFDSVPTATIGPQFRAALINALREGLKKGD